MTKLENEIKKLKEKCDENGYVLGIVNVNNEEGGGQHDEYYIIRKNTDYRYDRDGSFEINSLNDISDAYADMEYFIDCKK